MGIGEKPLYLSTKKHKNAAEIFGWAIVNVKWAAVNDILWVSDGTVSPTENALCWEVAAAIHAFLEGVIK